MFKVTILSLVTAFVLNLLTDIVPVFADISRAAMVIAGITFILGVGQTLFRKN